MDRYKLNRIKKKKSHKRTERRRLTHNELNDERNEKDQLKWTE